MEKIIDEPVSLSNHDADWIPMAKAEIEKIKEKIGRNFAIEHIGSTAVPCLLSKPVIDIQIGLPSWDTLSDVSKVLESLLYESLGEAGVPGRYYFRKRKHGSFNVHVMLIDSVIWDTNILIRDYLKKHEEEAKRYSEIKRLAFKSGASSLLSYSDLKAPYIAQLIALATHNE